MQDASNTSVPATPPGAVIAGVDWASTDHAACVVDATGAVVARFTVEHTAAGLARLVRGLTKAGATTRALLAVLTTLVEQIKTLSEQITEQLATHADAHVFTSLPRSGTVRAARLLAEIGDCRARFPDSQSLICLAGVAPSTRQSGKHKAVTFRWAANKQLRDAVCDFAADSRRTNPWAASPWAARLDNDAVARGTDHPHAARILARAWL